MSKSEDLTLVEKMFFLRKTSNFSTTGIEALSDLAAGTYEKRHRPGEVLWKRGDGANSTLLVLSGTLTCEAPDVKPWDFGVGMLVGGLDAMARRERWYSLTAKDDARVLVIETTLMFDVLEDHIDMAMQLLRALAMGVTAVLARMAQRDDAAA